MRTIRTKIYKFEELSNEAKQVAIKDYRNKQEYYLDSFNDDVVEQIENVGFYGDVKLQYSLSYCQGDGLSFSCDGIDESLLLSFFAEVLGEGKEKTAKLIIENSYFSNGGNNGRYCFASKNDIEYIFDSGVDAPNIENIVLQVETKIQNLYMELCKDLEKKGYEDIEYQCSDEAITETIIANDYEFLSNGKMY
jgi:hypothetical protein